MGVSYKMSGIKLSLSGGLRQIFAVVRTRNILKRTRRRVPDSQEALYDVDVYDSIDSYSYRRPGLLNLIRLSGADARAALPNGAGLIPGDTCEVSGHALKFDLNDPEQGLYFIVSKTGETFRVERYRHIAGRRLVFLIPPLPAGVACILELRTRPLRGVEIYRARSGCTLHIAEVAAKKV